MLTSPGWATETSRFELMASYSGLGGVEAEVVGPGPLRGEQRYYATYSYGGDSFDLVSISPKSRTTTVFPNPVAGEFGARAMIAGADGKIYIGTLPNAHLLQFDPGEGIITDLGRPVPAEAYIWDLCLGSDGRIYGGTYPSAKLIRYDPATHQITDLGRMDPVEQYAHSVAASGDGFVYAGIGSAKANIAAYELATGKQLEIGPIAYRTAGIADVFRAANGGVYATVNGHYFRLDHWNAIPIAATEVPATRAKQILSDGNSGAIDDHSLVIKDARQAVVSTILVSYGGREMQLFRLGAGPSETIYGSTAIPIHVVRYDKAERRLTDIGSAGNGEIYSILQFANHLLLAAYAGIAPLLELDPSRSFSQDSKDPNPVAVYFSQQDEAWRPQAMIVGQDGKVYIGPVGGYGKTSGAITVWDVQGKSVVSYPDVVHNQGIQSLLFFKNLLVGGSTVLGGGGSTSTEDEAVLFLWDTQANKRVFQVAPVPHAKWISDLIPARNGLIFGIAGEYMFVFDPVQRKVIRTLPLPFVVGSAIQTLYNSVAITADGKIRGLAPDGIFQISPDGRRLKLEARAPCKVTAGFVFNKGAIYFGCKSQLWRFNIP
jgi:hypothetical protein